ncbi:MAG: hypothetical protein OEM67_06445 [Thermoleophilia bacterium]|nr:hypothetical protein [Thermoleophilia bacterium]MDH3724289.1 hypothetical protein [Thermoleophilia bacterium]
MALARCEEDAFCGWTTLLTGQEATVPGGLVGRLRQPLHVGGARIQDGYVLDRVPQERWIAVDIRYVPGQDPDDILGEIRSHTDAELSVIPEQEPVGTPKNRPLVSGLISTATERMSAGRREVAP